MSVSVTLPQMGESVTEGTIVRWLKQEGETVTEDEPIVEISTDKIDTELPSPAAGVLSKILVGPDQTVSVGTELAVIDAQGSEPAVKATPATSADGEQRPAAARTPEPEAEESPPPAQPARAAEPAATAPQPAAAGATLSPLVRKLAREKGVDLSAIRGSGPGGRITKDDVLEAANGGGGAAPPAPAPAVQTQAAPRRAEAAPRFAVPASAHEDVPFDRVRRAIAEHMTRSLHVSAQLTNVVEVDMTRVAQVRAQAKAAFEAAEGFGLTFMPFIASAAVQALRAFPELNAHVLEDGATARIFKEVNLGIAVGRDEGLIVPVIHGADGMNLIGLARAIYDVGTRARTKGALRPDDVVGGTFSISNFGSFGGLIDTPIISQPQVAILGVGAVVKRPAVITVDGADAVAVRHMMFLSLTYDHRWLDGHRAAQFNGRIKQILEAGDFADDLGL